MKQSHPNSDTLLKGPRGDIQRLGFRVSDLKFRFQDLGFRCFQNIGGIILGVPRIRMTIVFRVHIGVPLFRETTVSIPTPKPSKKSSP